MKTPTYSSSASSGSRIIQGDCRQVLPTLPERSVDFVLTDPPYLVGYRDRNGRTVHGDRDSSWVRPAFAEIFRVLKDHRYCLSFYGFDHADVFIEAWKAAGFRLVGHFVFAKPYTSGTWHTQRRHEQAMLLAKGSPRRPWRPLPDVQPWGRYTGNRLHPTQKPVNMLQPLIRVFSRPGDLVLDPFCGSGSTLVAAQLEGRRGLGIEVDHQLRTIAEQRLCSSTGRLADTHT